MRLRALSDTLAERSHGKIHLLWTPILNLAQKNHRLNKFGRHRIHYKRKKFDTGCSFSSKPRQHGIQEVDPNALYNLFQDPGAEELPETLQGYISNPLDHAIRNQTPLGTA